MCCVGDANHGQRAAGPPDGDVLGHVPQADGGAGPAHPAETHRGAGRRSQRRLQGSRAACSKYTSCLVSHTNGSVYSTITDGI